MGRILVVDDDAQMRDMISETLKIAGHEVEDACDGAEAMNCLKHNRFDLAIIDIVMPEKEGIETIREVRRDYPDLKFFAISGGGRLGPRQYLEVAESLGASRTFVKPFERQTLLKAINKALDVQAAE